MKKVCICIFTNVKSFFLTIWITKNLGELYTKSLGGLTTKFWNVYGIEKDYEKSHVITDFIRKGFETGVIDMITDGQEERSFYMHKIVVKHLKQ